MKPRIRTIRINGHEYHLARDLQVWRTEVKKARGYDILGGDCHHIMGREGILKLLIENGIYFDSEIHCYQKSLSTEERRKFRREVARYIPLDLLGRLDDIKHQQRADPACFKNLIEGGEKNGVPAPNYSVGC
jgi:hypothetical protein